MRVFAEEPLFEIISWLEEVAATTSAASLRVLDPDRARGRYAGETVDVGGRLYIHRPYRVWVDLADRLRLRLLTPERSADGLVRLRFERLGPAGDEASAPENPREKYGHSSTFQRISKLEDPSFVLDIADAIDRVGLHPGARVLDIGINTGDEFELLRQVVPELASTLHFVGLDHSASALDVARRRFPGSNYRFIDADINDIEALEAEPFDLILSIGTLQSPGVDDREVFRHLVQRRLTSTGGVILGFPNCRYADGEVLYGARMRNFRQPELSLMIKDLAFYKKYLQQHRRRVYITGKHYVLVTGAAQVNRKEGWTDSTEDR